MTQHFSSLPHPPVALASYSPPGTFPDPDTCWTAVQQRNRAFNGRFWFSVKSTGVYCLPSCAARPPLRK
ncbi:MAG: bifunctional transcriptional activator/DNA repair enzyme protein Ada, partial [Alphaproteobacteria bacterium]|nr:bifunctional transcriptional activator/DNA repair enzyme protein Ada [Alphaproteobacteria bacterium]